jgi:hypothetical protein
LNVLFDFIDYDLCLALLLFNFYCFFEKKGLRSNLTLHTLDLKRTQIDSKGMTALGTAYQESFTLGQLAVKESVLSAKAVVNKGLVIIYCFYCVFVVFFIFFVSFHRQLFLLYF